MKIKLDENLPDRLVRILTALGHDVDTVRAEHLTGRTDPQVWTAAQVAQRFLITQDLVTLSKFTHYGEHAGNARVRAQPSRNPVDQAG